MAPYKTKAPHGAFSSFSVSIRKSSCAFAASRCCRSLSNAVVNRLGTIGDNTNGGYTASAAFNVMAKTGTYVSNQLLKRLLVKPSTVLPKGSVYMRNFGEWLPCRGGSIDTGAGLAALDLRNSHVFTGGDIGFRLAFA